MPRICCYCDRELVWEVEEGPFNDEYVELRLGENSTGYWSTRSGRWLIREDHLYAHVRCLSPEGIG